MDETTVTVSEYAQEDGELYAVSRVYEPSQDGDGVALPGHPGLWRLVATAGAIPQGAQPITERAYRSILDARRVEQDTHAAEVRDSEAKTLEQARRHLVSLGLADDAVEAILGGRVS